MNKLEECIKQLHFPQHHYPWPDTTDYFAHCARCGTEYYIKEAYIMTEEEIIDISDLYDGTATLPSEERLDEILKDMEVQE